MIDEEPGDVHQEAVLIASMVIAGNEALSIVRDAGVKPTDFIDRNHRTLFRGIISLDDQAKPYDAVNLYGWVRQQGFAKEITSAEFGHTISKDTTPSSLANSAATVRKLGALREMLERLEKGRKEGLGPPRDLRPYFEKLVADVDGIVLSAYPNNNSTHVSDVTSEVMEQLHNPPTSVAQTHVEDLDALLGSLHAGYNLVVAARPGMGKCLGVGTPVLMWDGSVRAIEDIAVGDTVVGGDGRRRRVLRTTRGTSRMFRVHQKKGMDYDVNEHHLLSLKLTDDGSVRHMTAEEWLCAPRKERLKGYKGGVVQWDERRDLKIDPYTLGVWIGDGHRQSGRVTCVDSEVWDDIEQIYDLGKPNTGTAQHPRALTRTVIGLQAKLREEGAFGKKEIPTKYRASGVCQRMDLLAGLIDSDGTLTSNCHVFTSKSATLAFQVKLLAESLGFACSISSRETRSQGGAKCVFCRVFISGNNDRIPVRVPRKRAHPRRTSKDHLRHGISISPLGEGEWAGIMVDGDSLYRLSDGTVVHNTALALQAGLSEAKQAHGVIIASIEQPKIEVVKRLIYNEAGVDGSRFRTGKPTLDDWSKVHSAGEVVASLPIRIIDDVSDVGHWRMRVLKEARALEKEGYPVTLVVTDYLQLMEAQLASNREQAIAECSRRCKALAKELTCAHIAVSQLNRGVESREDKRPMLADLRESGSIEQDADAIVFIYRDGYYKGDLDPRQSETELIVSKNRHGPMGTATVNMNLPSGRFG